jgi:hypothetical protein
MIQMGLYSSWGCIVSISVFDWGCISFSKGWGSIQEWGSIWADTVYAVLLITIICKSRTPWFCDFYWQTTHVSDLTIHVSDLTIECVWLETDVSDCTTDMSG